MGYHTKTATGELKKIIETSVEKIEKFIAHQLPDIVCAAVIPLLLIGYLFWLDWRMALVLLVPIGIGLWLQARLFAKPWAEGSFLYRRPVSYGEQAGIAGHHAGNN